MEVRDFIDTWDHAKLSERSASQSHFLQLCELLEEPKPAEVDPTGESYTFEKGAIKTTGARGWADVWKKGHFGWEYKGPGKDLEAAYKQLLTYSVALENPPLLIVSDLKRIIIRTNWNNTVQETYELSLDDLQDATKRQILKDAFSNPEALKPKKTRTELTEEAASEFAAIAKALRERGHDPEEVAHFINRMVFCMFAEDVKLLPDNIFTKMLERSVNRPADFQTHARTLFTAMRDKGGMVGFDHIEWFNGGLFDDDLALALEKAEIKIALEAAKLDWSEIDASILGTLFERGLDPDKRSQLGAHYTDREKIMMILNPVIVEPLTKEWEETRAAMQAEFEKAETAKDKGTQTKARNRAAKLHAAYIDKLTHFRVLDPACGSGNFLNLALLELKDLEHKANLDAEAMGLPRGFPSVGPESVKGIEINPYAAELARVSIWIGEIQWMLRNGFSASRNPILRTLGAIECADALIEQDAETGEWREKDWPEADVIVGNPPFLGGKRMRAYLGDTYVDQVRDVFSGRLPKFSDLVCYWFVKGTSAQQNHEVERVGLVSTNSIRGGANRKVLEQIVDNAQIFSAWSDEPWVVDGAAVRVSIVCFGHNEPRSTLNGIDVKRIWSDLTGHSGGAEIDITKSSRLTENSNRSFIGFQPSGEFDVPGETARQWILAPTNPNGRQNSEVLTPYWNSYEIIRRPRDRWIINLNELSAADASAFEAPFEYLLKTVHPARQLNTVKNQRDSEWLKSNWWKHWRSRPELFEATRGLAAVIATPLVSKHRVFVQAPSRFTPSNLVVAIARDDDTTFGILHSRFHELWSLRMGTWLGKGNDPRYTPTTTFETFPFPEGLTPNIPAAEYADDPHAQKVAAAAARLNELRENWLNPADLVKRVPEVVEGYPDRILPVDEAAEKELKKRTLTNLYNQRPAWLDHAHLALDEAVAEAYGWPADLSDDEVLAKLFELNQERAAAQG